MHTSLSIDAKVGLRLGRAAPQRSLPPCGGGTGRGVATRTVREAALKIRSWSGICPASGVQTTAVPVVPPSLSLPRMGGGNAVAPLFTPLTLHSRLRPDMCACPSACAGTTAESHCFTSSKAGTNGSYPAPTIAHAPATGAPPRRAIACPPEICNGDAGAHENIAPRE